MRIAFATVLSVSGSTNVGRIFPLVQELEKKGHQCHVLVVSSPTRPPSNVTMVGREPFRRTAAGKERLRGLRLITNMLATALRTAWVLWTLQPDIVVISKPLPANTLGVWLYSVLTPHSTFILDADDFELTANKLSSITQRGVVHWSERTAARIAQKIIVASPFLSDHFQQLTQGHTPITIIPTGLTSAGPAFIKTSTNQPGTSVRLAYIGSVSVSSGHRVDLLPEILAKLRTHDPTLRLLLAGDGDDVEGLTKEFKERRLADAVEWHGRFTPEEVSSLLTPGTILLDPVDDSIANRAKSSSRVLLAATFGLPVVTSDIGIRPSLLPEKFHQRFFADPADADSYVTKINDLIRQPLTAAERQELHSHAGNYTWANLATQYCDILTV